MKESPEGLGSQNGKQARNYIPLNELHQIDSEEEEKC